MTRERTHNLNLPVGTQVVTRVELPTTPERACVPAGAVGVISHAPADPEQEYEVTLVTGAVVSLRRSEFSIRKQHQQAGLTASGHCNESELRNGIILHVVVGSRAYGLERDASDTDIRGV